MALKKFDVPDIDDAISEAKDDEQRKEETAFAEKIACALEFFTNKSPDILKNMSDVVSQLDARKFAAVVSEELSKTADGMVRRFISKVEPLIRRAESADRRFSLPNLAAYIILVILVWLFIFLLMVIYANIKIRSDELTGLIVIFFLCLIVSIIAVIYLTKKYKW